jgi:hypothetical protein
LRSAGEKGRRTPILSALLSMAFNDPFVGVHYLMGVGGRDRRSSSTFYTATVHCNIFYTILLQTSLQIVI